MNKTQKTFLKNLLTESYEAFVANDIRIALERYILFTHYANYVNATEAEMDVMFCSIPRFSYLKWLSTMADINARCQSTISQHIDSYREKTSKCECHICGRHCIHRDALRRLPKSQGGLGLCPNLK